MRPMASKTASIECADSVGDEHRGIRDRLSALIDARATNPRAVAIKAGLNPTYVRDILTGKTKSPTLWKLKDVAAALDTSVNYILTGDGDEFEAHPRAREIKISESGSPQFVIEGDRVRINALLDREGVERLKRQLDSILDIMAP